MKKLKQIKKQLSERVQFKVEVEGLPPTFMTGKSTGEILQKLRKIVKQPSMIKNVERHTDVEVKKAYRNKAQGREMDEAVDATDTGGAEEVKMAMNQIKQIRHYIDGIEKMVAKNGDMEEWVQNKLTKATDYLKSVYGYNTGKVEEDYSYDFGNTAAAKHAKTMTPGQKEPTTAQKRIDRALKKHGVGKNDDFYKSQMDPETRKKYEPQKFERKPVSVEPPKHKPFQWIRTK